MTTRAGRGVRLLRWRASARAIVLVAAAFTVQATSGCLSNEYRVQRNELQRLATLPPDARGEGVRVSQQLGERRGDAVDVTQTGLRQTVFESELEPRVDVQLDVSGGNAGSSSCCRGPGPAHGASGSSGWRSAAPSSGAWRGAPPPGGSHSGAFDTVVNAGAHVSGGGGGGGNGNAAAALAIVAVVIVVSAAVATVLLAASEGARYEGHARVAPTQIVHLAGATGALDVPLSALTPEQAAVADSGVLMDDEGYGMLRLDHAPLDRKGPLFRFELGGGAFTFQGARAVGLMSHIQSGLYLTHSFGLVVDLGLGSGTLTRSCCVGVAVGADSLTRHSLGLEAQGFPFGVGPLHLGGFAGAGVALVGAGGAWWSGPVAGAGALVELDVTSHLALTLRGGANAADLPGGWSSAVTLTGGLTIY
jgi:hypothetical protein